VTSHPEYESDDDTGMYTETISKYGLETKLLKKRIQSTDGSSKLSTPDSILFVEYYCMILLYILVNGITFGLK